MSRRLATGGVARAHGRFRSVFAEHFVEVTGRYATDLIAQRIQQTGLVTVSGMTDVADIAGFAARVMDQGEYQGTGPRGLHEVRDSGQHVHRADATERTRSAMDLHTYGAALAKPPHLALVVCLRADVDGGESLLADGEAVFYDLAGERPEAAHALSLPDAAHFGTGEQAVRAQVFQARTGQRRSVRLRQDGLIHWSKRSQPHLPALRSALDRHRHVIDLSPGQGYLIDNHRWLHGRTRFSGDRLFFRAEGEARFASSFPEGSNQ